MKHGIRVQKNLFLLQVTYPIKWCTLSFITAEILNHQRKKVLFNLSPRLERLLLLKRIQSPNEGTRYVRIFIIDKRLHDAFAIRTKLILIKPTYLPVQKLFSKLLANAWPPESSRQHISPSEGYSLTRISYLLAGSYQSWCYRNCFQHW